MNLIKYANFVWKLETNMNGENGSRRLHNVCFHHHHQLVALACNITEEKKTDKKIMM